MHKQLNSLYAGVSASVTSSLLTHPIDVVKVNVQTKNVTPFDFIRGTPVHHLYKGIGASVLRNATFVGSKMFAYDALKAQVQPTTLPERLVCGMGAGFIGAAIGSPFDVSLVRMQTYPERYPTIYQTFVRTYTEDGMRGFWKGCEYTMSRAMLVTACQFGVYDELKQRLRPYTTNDHTLFVSSSVMSSFVTALVSNPVDLCKNRVMNNHPSSTIASVIRNEGVSTLWKGMVPNLARQVPLNLTRFSCLEFFRDTSSKTTL